MALISILTNTNPRKYYYYIYYYEKKNNIVLKYIYIYKLVYYIFKHI